MGHGLLSEPLAMERELEVLVMFGEEGDLVALQEEVRLHSRLSQGGGQDLVALQGVERLSEGGGEGANAAPFPLLLAEEARADIQRIRRLQSSLDPVQPGDEGRAGGQVRVAGAV